MILFWVSSFFRSIRLSGFDRYDFLVYTVYIIIRRIILNYVQLYEKYVVVKGGKEERMEQLC